MGQRKVRECDQCHKELADGAKRYEFGGFVAIVNGWRTEGNDISETCSPGCAEARFRTLLRHVTAAEQAATKTDRQTIAAA
jgi:hypothetical protein